jgi:hypothetical protein
LLEHW